MQRLASILAMGVLVLFSGCVAEPPANLPNLYQVAGVVQNADGVPVAGGTLQFQ